MKIAPILRAIGKHNARVRAETQIQTQTETKIKTETQGEVGQGLNLNLDLSLNSLLVHTGQHYDYEMSRVFFDELELPEPEVYLGVGSGSHAEQTGKVMTELERILLDGVPDLVVVVGDVNSTLGAALAAVKLGVPVAHIEAGLRSYDRSMPEEINRLLTDAIAEFLFTPSPDADDNLRREGIPDSRIYLVGNVMVDSLLASVERASRLDTVSRFGLEPARYAVLTLHRPENVDRKQNLTRIGTALQQISQRIPIVFPCHPRSRKSISHFGLQSLLGHVQGPESDILPRSGLLSCDPLGYLEFLNLMMNCRFTLTDSGGIQEETTALGIPCLTLRENTERPITVTQGTNVVVGTETERIVTEAYRILDGNAKKGTRPELWDGRTAERIVETLAQAGSGALG